MTVSDLPQMQACERDADGACSTHDHGTAQDRVARYGLCPVCRGPLDYQLLVVPDGAWTMSSYCPDDGVVP